MTANFPELDRAALEDLALRQNAAVANLLRQRDALLAALRRLMFAADGRENTMGDPLTLLEAKAELRNAAADARAAIALCQKESAP